MTEESDKSQEPRIVMVEASQSSSGDEINLIEILRLLMSSWRLIGGVTFLVVSVAVAYALLAPEVYRAEVLLAPVEEEKSQMASALGQFGGLANLAGIPIPADANKEQVLATLRSRKFIQHYIEEKNLLPVLFKEQWDSAKEEWKVESGNEPLTEEKAYIVFSEVMDVSEDKKTGLVTLSISWEDPELAAEWANELVRRLNEELQSKAIRNSQNRIGYIEKELAKTTVKDMKEVLYSLLESEKQKAMLANVNEEFALEVIDPAVAPELREKPNRTLIVTLGGFSGLSLGVFIVFMREFFKKLLNPIQAKASA
tara:strand:+ start:693 stop:1628 length:936 start_codon:yes stop_codon:yes gene_type:complete